MVASAHFVRTGSVRVHEGKCEHRPSIDFNVNAANLNATNSNAANSNDVNKENGESSSPSHVHEKDGNVQQQSLAKESTPLQGLDLYLSLFNEKYDAANSSFRSKMDVVNGLVTWATELGKGNPKCMGKACQAATLPRPLTSLMSCHYLKHYLCTYCYEDASNRRSYNGKETVYFKIDLPTIRFLDDDGDTSNFTCLEAEKETKLVEYYMSKHPLSTQAEAEHYLFESSKRSYVYSCSQCIRVYPRVYEVYLHFFEHHFHLQVEPVQQVAVVE